MAPANEAAVALAAELPQYARFVDGTLMFHFEPETEVQHPRYVVDGDDSEGEYSGLMEGLEELMPHLATIEEHLGFTRERRLTHGRTNFESLEECPYGHGSLGVDGECSDCGYSASRHTAIANLQLHAHAHRGKSLV